MEQVRAIRMLGGQVALVTGASRGIGRGIALQLGQAGATVYVTGREPKNSDGAKDSNLPSLEKTAKEITDRGGKGIAVYCDHSNPEDVKRLFERIEHEQNGRLDILVNNAFAAVGKFMDLLTGKELRKFYELDPLIWDDVNNVGLRNHYICSVYAARLMAPRKSGLIVTVSSAGGLQYMFNVAYGVGKEGCDRLASDMAVELKSDNITSVSLWPGAVRTELVMKSVEKGYEGDLKNMFLEGETIEYSGRAVVHLAADKNRIKHTGRVLVTSDVGDEYGFTDIDGRHPPNFRSLKELLKYAKWSRTASYVPAWVKVPGTLKSHRIGSIVAVRDPSWPIPNLHRVQLPSSQYESYAVTVVVEAIEASFDLRPIKPRTLICRYACHVCSIAAIAADAAQEPMPVNKAQTHQPSPEEAPVIQQQLAMQQIPVPQPPPVPQQQEEEEVDNWEDAMAEWDQVLGVVRPQHPPAGQLFAAAMGGSEEFGENPQGDLFEELEGAATHRGEFSLPKDCAPRQPAEQQPPEKEEERPEEE